MAEDYPFEDDVSIDRRASMASVSTTGTFVVGGSLLDRLDLGDEDAPWAKKRLNPLQELQQKRAQGLTSPSPVNKFINNSPNVNNIKFNIKPEGRSRFSLRNSLRRKTTSEDKSAIQTAEALGSTVNEVHRTTGVVGHTNVEEPSFIKATLDNYEYDEDEEDNNNKDYQSSMNSSTFLPSTLNDRPSASEIKAIEDPNELRVKKALQLRKEGNPRESSYELSIAAHHGSRTAKYLYGIALRDGIGLRVDYKQSFLWICRAAPYDNILDANQDYSVDPFTLKEDNIPKVPPHPEAYAFFDLAIAYLNGMGIEKNENRALEFLEKSASLGNVEAMTQAGMLWQKKGHNRKKDMYRSAAWLRLAEKRGDIQVGNSWIHKDKYMKKKK